MKLREPHSLGMLDHHQRGIRHVHSYFDYSRRNEQIDLTAPECAHDCGLLVALQTSMDEPDLELRKIAAQCFECFERRFQLQRVPLSVALCDWDRSAGACSVTGIRKVRRTRAVRGCVSI